MIDNEMTLKIKAISAVIPTKKHKTVRLKSLSEKRHQRLKAQ